jgi:Glycosyl transferase family 2
VGSTAPPAVRPRLSVVIPTRNRTSTLLFTLQTCVAQDFRDCEFVVSDNSDDPGATRDLVARFQDSRLRYVRPPRVLAMTDSWEFALGSASGEYVTVIGSDDGLLLHALPEVDRLCRVLGDPPVLHWDSVCYTWPDLPNQAHAGANDLLIPLGQTEHYHPIRRTEARPLLIEAANSRLSYANLPMIFGSAIHRSLIERLRATTGRVFRSQSPDVYSAFTFGHLAGTYHWLAAPMTISGLSSGSNGVALIYLRGKSPIADDFRRRNAEAGHGCHRRIPDVPALAALVADSFQVARDAFFPDDPALVVDRQAVVRLSLDALAGVDEEDWRAYVAAVRDAVQDDKHLSHWFDAEFGDRPPASGTPVPVLPRYGGTYLRLDAAEFGVKDVLGASELCERLLGYRRDGVNAHLTPEAGLNRPDRPLPPSRWLGAALRRIRGRARPPGRR